MLITTHHCPPTPTRAVPAVFRAVRVVVRAVVRGVRAVFRSVRIVGGSEATPLPTHPPTNKHTEIQTHTHNKKTQTNTHTHKHTLLYLPACLPAYLQYLPT